MTQNREVARIEDDESRLRVNGRRWHPCENTHSTAVEVARQGQYISVNVMQKKVVFDLPGTLR